MWRQYDEKIKEYTCSVCGKQRPYDWFRLPYDTVCWKCRELSKIPKPADKKSTH